ncbi:ATP-dependent dethiobiotin synthetase BioD [Phyllobacterium brassicacearum]|uniref:ATP-dependent dethiobiotin synthetase BioD n=1 Tax=Phyllobacterium brassicacearum TaxID=314235 RepID=A0A2P7BUB6_9HYPH|nr:dethiobiotin synthase [Phyllobacterium brassicacearum]PSH70069.1 ATP-dependent dethiobiotin synthetase BioD [Phyllobacterium brassicacearum]TDQ34070.1 dethiobiotin synthase [Phyllobacterium brassicacearum]
MTLRFVVTGTDTNIGKTVFAAALTDALGASYWKPVQSGLDGETDSETVQRLGRISSARIFPEAWRLNTPASPHLAARIDNARIDPEALSPPVTEAPLVIEGAGGVLVPLTESEVFADVLARWQIPVVLCARTGLGTINHTLLSLEALRHRSIPVFGVVFIGDEQADTQKIIAKLGNVNCLGRLPCIDPLTPDTLRQAFRDHFDVSSFQKGIL